MRTLALLALPFFAMATMSAAQSQESGASKTSAPRTVHVRNTPEATGYHVHVLVNGLKVRMLVDTGSNVTVLSQEDAYRVGAAMGKAEEVDAYGGVAIMYATQIRSLVIAGAEVGPVLDAAIDNSSNSESILGMDVLDRPGIVMHVEGGVMTLAFS